jgi:hypothetical protein
VVKLSKACSRAARSTLLAVSQRLGASIKRVLVLAGGPGARSAIVTALMVEDTRSATWALAPRRLLYLCPPTIVHTYTWVKVGACRSPGASAVHSHRTECVSAEAAGDACTPIHTHTPLTRSLTHPLTRFSRPSPAPWPSCLSHARRHVFAGAPVGWAEVICRRDSSEPALLDPCRQSALAMAFGIILSASLAPS